MSREAEANEGGVVYLWIFFIPCLLMTIFAWIIGSIILTILFGFFSAVFGCGIWESNDIVKNGKQAYEQSMERYERQKEKAEETARENVNKRKEIETYYSRRISYYKNELNKTQRLLDDFYSMNIVPLQYRNLKAICYIYDYMSTSQATLEETLYHEHMESGIQRLEDKLDIIAEQVEMVLYETRCMRQENKASVERIINQNSGMLNHLKNIERNSADAALYAELSANYSKANAYFSVANYLK